MNHLTDRQLADLWAELQEDVKHQPFPKGRQRELNLEERQLVWMLRRVQALPYEPPRFDGMPCAQPIFEEFCTKP